MVHRTAKNRAKIISYIICRFSGDSKRKNQAISLIYENEVKYA